MKKQVISLYWAKNILIAGLLMLLLASNTIASGTSHNSDADFRQGTNNGGFIIQRAQSLNSLQYSYLSDTYDAFTIAAYLPVPLEQHDAVTGCGYIFVIGGGSNGAVQSAVYSALIGANGSLGEWQTLISLPEPLENFRAVYCNGYIFVAGGYNGTTGSNRVYSAKINCANGTIGAWQVTTEMPFQAEGHCLVAVGGYLYVIGGYDRTQVQINVPPLPSALALKSISKTARAASGYDVISAKINANGTLGDFSALDPFPGYVSDKDAIVSNGKITVMAPPYIYQAEIGNEGTLGGWTTQTAEISGSMPSGFRAAQGFGAVFIAGGYQGYYYNWDSPQTQKAFGPATPISSVFIAKFDLLGLCAWQANEFSPLALPVPLSHNAPVIEGEHLFVIGGFNSDIVADSAVVYATKINKTINGELHMSDWTSLATMPNAIAEFKATALNNKIWIFGGYDSGNGYWDNVYSATVNLSGTLGTWQLQTDLPIATASYGLARDGNYAFIIGGSNGSHNIDAGRNSVYSSLLNSDGTNDAWVDMVSVFDMDPLSDYYHFGGALNSNGHLYHIGGGSYNQNDAVPDVLSAPLDVGGVISDLFTNTTQLPSSVLSTGLIKFGAVSYGNYVFTFGGLDGQSTVNIVNTVFSARTTSSGTISSWNTLTDTPLPSDSYGISADNYYEFAILGGCADGGNDFYSTKLADDGKIATFTEMVSGSFGSSSFFDSYFNYLKYFGTVIVNNRLYVLGGMNSSGQTVNTAKYSKLERHKQPYQGRYSNFFDLGSDRMIKTLRAYLTSHPTSTLQIRYRTAPYATGIYSDWSLFTTNTTVQVNTEACYLQYEIKVDNSSPENQSTPMSVDEVEITIVENPVIQDVDPNSGNIGDIVDVTINGNNFDERVNGVFLEYQEVEILANSKNNKTKQRSAFKKVAPLISVAATNIVVVDSNTITCRFNLADIPEGYYDVVVKTIDDVQSILPDGFYAINATWPHVIASPTGNIYNKDTEVALTCDKAKTKIYYRLSFLPLPDAVKLSKNKMPEDSFTLYEAPITVAEDKILEAYAVDNNELTGPTTTEYYVIRYQPVILSAIAGDGFIFIAWEDETRADYKLYYGVSSGSYGDAPVLIEDGNFAYLTGLANNTTYYLRLKSVDVNGIEYGEVEIALTPTPTQVNVSAGVTSDSYRMISLPKDISMSDFLAKIEAQLGAYNDSNWRLFKYDPASDSYKEYSDIEAILNDVYEVYIPYASAVMANTILGNGFWIIAKSGLALEEATLPPSQSTLYSVVILKPGWNQIGTPANFVVPWSSVSAEDFEENPLPLMNLYSFGSDGYAVADSLLPGQGYFVNNSTESDIAIKIPANPGVSLGTLPYIKQSDAPLPPAPPCGKVEDAKTGSNGKGFCFIAEASYTQGRGKVASLIEKVISNVSAFLGLK